MSVSYTAVYDYDSDDRAWIVEIAEEPRCHTFGRTLAAAKRQIRDALTMWADGEYTVADQVNPPAIARQAVEAALEARARVPEVMKEADRLTRAATTHLVDAGLSVREAAAVLGISYQRVGQLTAKRRTV